MSREVREPLNNDPISSPAIPRLAPFEGPLPPEIPADTSALPVQERVVRPTRGGIAKLFPQARQVYDSWVAAGRRLNGGDQQMDGLSPVSRLKITPGLLTSMVPFVRRIVGPLPESDVANASEMVAESTAVIGMVVAAFIGVSFPVVAYEASGPSLDRAPEYGMAMNELRTISDLVSLIRNSAQMVSSNWDNRYSYIDPNCSTDDKGETTCNPTTEWNEPSAITNLGIDHLTLRNWDSGFSQLSSRISNAINSSSGGFDMRQGPTAIALEQTDINVQTQKIIAAVIILAVGMGYANYEEVLTHLARENGEQPMVDADSGIGRRSFIKGLGSIVAMVAMVKSYLGSAEENMHLEPQIREEINKVVTQLNVPDDDIFNRAMGVSVTNIRRTLTNIREKTAIATTKGYADNRFDWNYRDKTNSDLKNLGDAATNSLAGFDRLINYDPKTGSYKLPAEMIFTLKMKLGTDRIKDYVASSKLAVGFGRHLLVALQTVGILAVSATIAEMVVSASSE